MTSSAALSAATADARSTAINDVSDPSVPTTMVR
jgi:hypothetical protein